jgi:triacylglycerol lipase
MLVAVVALVVVAGAVAGTVRGLAGTPAVPPADAGRPGDVLLVPGYGGSTTALDVLAGRITAAGGSGFHATVVRLAGDGTGDLQVQASVLNRYVNQALARGSGPVTVIGYSAGGVVAWGSSPLPGSSRMSSRGWRISAAARPRRCRMPSE